MSHLTIELHRILLRRITAALRKARYEPESVKDEEAAARAVLRPFAPKMARELDLTDQAIPQ